MGIGGTARGDLIVSGGGVHNPQIMGHLAGFLPGMAISTSTDHGIDADAKEAIAFAVLARADVAREAGKSAFGDGRAAGGGAGKYHALKIATG